MRIIIWQTDPYKKFILLFGFNVTCMYIKIISV